MRLVTLSLLAALAGCGMFDGGTEPAGRPPPPFRGTTAPTNVERDVPVNTLRNLDIRRQDRFDSVEFQFQNGRLPGYTVEFVAGPLRLCESGIPTEVRGSHFVRVRFDPARSDVSDTWQRLSGDTLTGVRELCRRGQNVSWVVGLDHRAEYRVRELQNPPRIVIDFAHSRADRVSLANP